MKGKVKYNDACHIIFQTKIKKKSISTVKHTELFVFYADTEPRQPQKPLKQCESLQEI